MCDKVALPTQADLAARAGAVPREPDRFDFHNRLDDGTTVYSAPHEIWNAVSITFPPGYWDSEDGVYPAYVETRFDLDWPEYRKIPFNDVMRELQRRLPNVLVHNMYPGFLAIAVPGRGNIACGGDSDGWRIEHQLVDGPDPTVAETIDTALGVYEQDVNKIVSCLIHTLVVASPWADDLFGQYNRPKGV